MVIGEFNNNPFKAKKYPPTQLDRLTLNKF